MSVGKICTRIVATASEAERVREVAARMEAHNVGTVVVVDGERSPTGILTDRDIAIRCVGKGRDPDHTPVSEIMTRPVRTARLSTPIEDALDTMRRWAVRRIVVVDDDGALAGVLAVDDVLDLLVEEVDAIGGILRREVPLIRP